MKKKIAFAIVLIIICVIVLYSSIRDNTVHIATLGYYTSASTTASIDAYRMVDYVLNEINEEDNRYEVIRFDLKDYTDLDKLKTAMDNAHIDLVIGPNTSSEAEPLIEFLTSLEIPVFLTTVSSDIFSNLNDNIYRITDTLKEQTKQAAGVIMDKTEGQDLTIFYTTQNINFSKAYADSIENIYKDYDISVKLIEVGELEDKSVQQLLQEEITTDVALLIAPPGKAGIITGLIALNNETVEFYHSSWCRSDATAEYISGIENRVYSLGAVKPAYEDNYNKFVDEILVEHNLVMNSFVYTGFEVMYLVDHIIKNTGSYKLKDIQGYMKDIGVYQGKFNDFTFNDTGDGGRGYSLLKIEDGKYSIEIDYLTY